MMDREYTYHSDIKNKYIETKGTSVVATRVAQSEMKRIDFYENKYGKEILQWTIKEFDEFFQELERPNVLALRTYRTNVVKYMELLETNETGHNKISKNILNTYSGDKLKSLIKKEKVEKNLITCYDYEKIMDNSFSDDKLELIEQIFFFMFWHKTVKTPNDIFEFSMDNIDLQDKTITQCDGTIDYLTDAEVTLVKKFKEVQNTGIEIVRAKQKRTDFCGCIEINTDLVLYTELESNNLIHPVLGSGYIGIKNGKAVKENKLKDEPMKLKFGNGSGRVQTIIAQINEKTGFNFRPSAIERSRVYEDVIQKNELTLEKFKHKSMYSLLKDVPNSSSCSSDELRSLLIKRKQQELQKIYD